MADGRDMKLAPCTVQYTGRMGFGLGILPKNERAHTKRGRLNQMDETRITIKLTIILLELLHNCF